LYCSVAIPSQKQQFDYYAAGGEVQGSEESWVCGGFKAQPSKGGRNCDLSQQNRYQQSCHARATVPRVGKNQLLSPNALGFGI